MARPPIIPDSTTPLTDRIGNCKNPELAQWLKELWQEAYQKEGNKLQYVYRRAMDNMIVWPDPILDIKDAHKVPYVGPTIVARLEKRLRKFIQDGGQLVHGPTETLNSQPNIFPVLVDDDPVDILPRLSLSQPPNENVDNNNDKRPSTKISKPRATRPYVPTYRSGPYAMLIALYLEALQPSSKGYCTRQEIVSLGQPYCQVQMEEGTFSALKGAIKKLEEKDLVSKSGVPHRYSLTEEGFEMAEKLWNSGERRSSAPIPARIEVERSDNDIELQTRSLKDSDILTFHWAPGTYEIKLLIDNREVKSRNERDYIFDQLQANGIPVEQRCLDLGDFIWIAKRNPEFLTRDHDDLEEAVLDLLIERKTEDDLLHSIIDGRFVEQKFRINSSGISSRIYLLERFEGLDLTGIGEAKFKAAIMHTQILDDLILRYTSNLEDSMKFIIAVHRDLVAKHSSKIIHLAFDPDSANTRRGPFLSKLHKKSQEDSVKYLMSYSCYSVINSKTGDMSLKDLLLRQLMTIKLMSAERAYMIAERFQTPIALYNHFTSLTDDDTRRNYFKDWCMEGQLRKFGTSLSQRIFETFWLKKV